MSQKLRVLITVKTYPLPSREYQELVCTAGVQEDGSFVRLYPIDYRYRPYWQWYKTPCTPLCFCSPVSYPSSTSL